MKIMGIGAHYDDCIFGIPGILLRAVDRGHDVTVLSVIGNYENWSPVGAERQDDMITGTTRLFEEKGITLKFLNHKSMNIEVNQTSKKAVAQVVAEVEPDMGFLLWPHDSHPDHEAVSELSKIAFNWAGTVLGESSRVRRPKRLYYYDNGPRHTLGFEPDTFVDMGEYATPAIDWLTSVMSFVVGPQSSLGVVEAKNALAAYRGKACGVSHAEAVKSFQNYPVDIF
ncbi:MAG: PIG-L deacetylase family protein [Candidatus Latescibacterota bacterium]